MDSYSTFQIPTSCPWVGITYISSSPLKWGHILLFQMPHRTSL